PPLIEPLNVVTPLASVNGSAAALPTSASIEVASMPATVTAFGPLMLQAVTAFGPVSVSAPEPPVSVSMLLNEVVVFSVPVFAAEIAQALVPSVAASSSVPPPPLIEPLNVVTPLASVNVSAAALPTSASIEVASMPATVTAFGPLMLQAVTAFGPVSVSVPEPPVSVSMLLNE